LLSNFNLCRYKKGMEMPGEAGGDAAVGAPVHAECRSTHSARKRLVSTILTHEMRKTGFKVCRFKFKLHRYTAGGDDTAASDASAIPEPPEPSSAMSDEERRRRVTVEGGSFRGGGLYTLRMQFTSIPIALETTCGLVVWRLNP
jgi:hypothetical protein